MSYFHELRALSGLVVVASIFMSVFFRRADRRFRPTTHDALTRYNPFDRDGAPSAVNPAVNAQAILHEFLSIKGIKE